MDQDLLRHRTEAADAQHRAAMATVHQDLERTHLDPDEQRAASRRFFLRRAGAGAAVVLGGAAVPLTGMASAAWAQEPEGGEGGDAETNGDACPTDPVDMPASDEQLVTFAESVERAASAAYELALEQRLLVPVTEQSAHLFSTHHEDHAEALRCLLGTAAQEPNAALLDELRPQIEEAVEEDALIQLFRQLEEGAAATYLVAIGAFETIEVASAAATIMPVEAQHAVVWSEVLDLPLAEVVPAFASNEAALDTDAYAI